MPVFCHYCHLEIAPFDPTRIQKELHVYHESCLRKEQGEKEVIRINLGLAQPASQRLQ